MTNKRDPNKIYLSFVREGDAFSIQDQDGRKVAGLKGAELKFQQDDLAEIHMRVLDCTVAHDEETWHIGKPRPGAGKPNIEMREG